MKKTVILLSLMSGAAFMSKPAVLHAAVKQTYSINGTDTAAGSQSFFDGNISTTDLINSGRPTLGLAAASTTAASGFSTAGANNGNGTAGTLTFWNNVGTPQTLTYTLAGSATGYDITSISTIYGWSDGAYRFADQEYDVSFATVANPTFTLFGTKTTPTGAGGFTANVAASSQNVWTEDSTGILQSGVTAIRFTIRGGDGSQQIGVIREIDVFGSPTPVPEPSALAFLGLGSLAVVMRRRK